MREKEDFCETPAHLTGRFPGQEAIGIAEAAPRPSLQPPKGV